jgi:hypothetical protein
MTFSHRALHASVLQVRQKRFDGGNPSPWYRAQNLVSIAVLWYVAGVKKMRGKVYHPLTPLSQFMPSNPSRILLLVLLSTGFAICSAQALLAPGNIQVSPPGDSMPVGSIVNVSATIEIIPSGATTFAETHTLSLSTGLVDARWHVVVTVDGQQAAVIPKDGPQVFVNGFLLSYPTTRDVSVSIAVDGRAPPDPAAGTVVVLEWAELNSQGLVVAGSDYQVTRQAETFPASPVVTTATQAPVLTTSPANIPFPVMGAAASLCLVFGWIGRRKG